jgi:hypothetical protein
MTLINRISVGEAGQERAIELFSGDVSAIPESEQVDLLVVSAFPSDYYPTSTSLIGALHAAGVSVQDLAKRKAVDLREFSSCWLSEPIDKPGVHFKRLLCFEPLVRGAAPEVVGDIFRSLVPFCTGDPPIKRIAMPLVAAGDQGESPAIILQALVDAALHWLAIGLPVDCIKIVICGNEDLVPLVAIFSKAKAEAETSGGRPAKVAHRFDAFLSYSHKDKDAADDLINLLKATMPSLRLFVDRLELKTGSAWQQHIFEALDDCHKIIPLLSPSYVASTLCKEEFNIAIIRHRESSDGVLLPVFLLSAPLPSYMKVFHFLDVREDDRDKLKLAAGDLVKSIQGITVG